MVDHAKIVLINLKGTDIVFGRSPPPDNANIYFNVLGVDPGNQGDGLHWTRFAKLESADGVRHAGMGLVTLKNDARMSAGGMRREASSVVNIYSQTCIGAISLNLAAGLEFNGNSGSRFRESCSKVETMTGNTWTMKEAKSKSAASARKLNCSIVPTDFLCAPIIAQGEDGQLKFGGRNRHGRAAWGSQTRPWASPESHPVVEPLLRRRQNVRSASLR
jgi:hypothetical protein